MPYKCFTSDIERLEKRINAIGRKLDKYGLKWHFEILREYPQTVSLNKIAFNGRYTECFKVKDITVSVTEYEFTMDQLKLGDYQIIAIIEHMEKSNVVYQMDETITLDSKYQTISGICEHCNIKRQRNKTALLADKNGNIKQVGLSCLSEYTGIDDISIISIYKDIHDITIDTTKDGLNENEYNGSQQYFETASFISVANSLINKDGYKKADEGKSTRNETHKFLSECSIVTITDEAKAIIDFFRNNTFNDTFNNNIKAILESDYIHYKHMGIACYAPVAYKKAMMHKAEENEKNEIKKLSNYFGNIGDKIQLELTIENRFSFEVCFGYNFSWMNVYKFKDNQNNTFIWKTQNVLEYEKKTEYHTYLEQYQIGDKITLKGTIKEHSEYKDEKQTVLTRCKVI
jgi:hypothetical protein